MKTDVHPYSEIVFGKTNDGNEDRKKLREAALKRAWETRTFEIQLYWQRALYFWGFIALCFAGYFDVYGEKGKEELPLIVAVAGYVFSLAWFLVNKASKFWQENWEGHIDCLEDEFEGSIYKTVLINKSDLWNPTKGYPFSVSQINQFCSLFVVIIWLVLIVKSLSFLKVDIFSGTLTIGVQVIATIFIISVLTWVFWCKSRTNFNSNKVDEHNGLIGERISDCKYRAVRRKIEK